MTKERGVSSVVGVVLLLAITLTMVTSLMVIGTLALNETQSDTQLSQMETSMAQMSSKASLAALGGADEERFDLGGTNDGFVEIDPDAGNLTVESVNPQENETTELYSTDSFGAVIFQLEDEEVAYQGGGVWGAAGDDGGSMISPPEYHYREETLTFPIIRVTGADRADGIARGTVEHESFDSIYPNETLRNPVDNVSVFVEVQSEYHRGWFEFFESRTTGMIEHDPANQTVRMELTVPFAESFHSSIAVGESYETRGNPDINESEIDEGANYPSVSQEVDDHIDHCLTTDECEDFADAGPDNFTGDQTYFANDSIDEFGSDITFNTSDGDIKVVFNGTYENDQSDFIVEGNNSVHFFHKEAPAFGNQEINREGEKSADQFRVYMHSDIEEWNYGENPSLRAIIYAPSTEITLTGSFDLTGAIVAEELEMRGSVSIEYDEEIEGVSLGFDPLQEIIRFLHVTENVINVSLD